ncbi:MAG: hypothetical protein AAB948_02970 [Patescibacteria group bacterium]
MIPAIRGNALELFILAREENGVMHVVPLVIVLQNKTKPAALEEQLVVSNAKCAVLQGLKSADEMKPDQVLISFLINIHIS